MSSNIRINKICAFCEKEFIARTTKTRYCNHTCNRRAYKKNVRKEKFQNVFHELEVSRENKLQELNEKPFLTIKEVCQLLGIGKTNFYSLIKSGMVIPAKFGKRTIIDRKQINSFFK